MNNASVPPEQLDDNTSSGKSGRRSRWISSLAAFKYISHSYTSDAIKTRSTDKSTNLLFMVAIFLASTWLLFPNNNAGFGALCDLFFGITIVFYLANRLGVLSTLTPKQAVLIAQIITSSLILGIYLTANVVAMNTWIHRVIESHQ